jgi:fructose-1,6-bisphosphatase/inositol monophosphatase family enzyme
MSHLSFVASLFRDYDALVMPLHGSVAALDKDDGSSVTRADREASALVVARLKTYAPDAGIICEEEAISHQPDARLQWAIDPLDGTASFARGLPVWGLGIGLLDGDAAVAGYLRFPAVHQTFVCENGSGRCNGMSIASMTSAGRGISADTRNVMITSIHDYVDIRRMKGYRFHNLGSNLYHLMMLACGRCEAIITGPCYLWDLAPALPFTRAAGCVERYLDGSPLDIDRLLAPPYGFPIAQPMIVGPVETVTELCATLG